MSICSLISRAFSRSELVDPRTLQGSGAQRGWKQSQRLPSRSAVPPHPWAPPTSDCVFAIEKNLILCITGPVQFKPMLFKYFSHKRIQWRKNSRSWHPILHCILHCIMVVCFQLPSPAIEGGSLGPRCWATTVHPPTPPPLCQGHAGGKGCIALLSHTPSHNFATEIKNHLQCISLLFLIDWTIIDLQSCAI